MKLVTLRTSVDHKPRADDFVVIDTKRPECPSDGIVVRVAHISLDPYVGSRLRGRHMGEAPPMPMRDAIPGGIVGAVVESKSATISEGDVIHSMEGGWAEYVAIKDSHARRIDPDIAPLRAHLSSLGMPGLTAWAGVSQLAGVKDGETFLVDAAAGAVGGTAGQIARLLGATNVIGIAGGDRKCHLVTEQYGFDACIDYKSGAWHDALKDAVGDGVDVFFENVSAEMAMIALTHAKPYVRGVLCGLVADYHSETQSQHPLNAGLIVGKRAQILGLVVYDFYPRWDEYVAWAAPHVREGRITIAEDRADGLDAAPALFERLMDGANIGKCIVDVIEGA